MTSTLDPLIFMKKSMQFNSNVVFGSYNNSTKNCPTDKSRIDISFNYGCYKDDVDYSLHIPISKDDPCSKVNIICFKIIIYFKFVFNFRKS